MKEQVSLFQSHLALKLKQGTLREDGKGSSWEDKGAPGTVPVLPQAYEVLP